ncbi:hypothetical protein LXA43DRAFT_1094097 [Ganoderma leucocontextum]|nr:hypothetical protein LXA43DRAFT_1094097 [Ganoderma leucocontextum]
MRQPMTQMQDNHVTVLESERHTFHLDNSRLQRPSGGGTLTPPAGSSGNTAASPSNVHPAASRDVARSSGHVLTGSGECVASSSGNVADKDEHDQVRVEDDTIDVNDEDDTVDVEIIIGPNTTHHLAPCLNPTSLNFIRPEPTDDELLTSSMWAQSGRPDPSVEIHPLSSWYRWFCETAPIFNGARILSPREPDHSTDTSRPIPYSLPPYIFALLGPDAVRKDKGLADRARLLIDAGLKTKPPPPRPGLFGDLGEWKGVKITTILQAHNLRHCAVSDRDARSEGVQYLMKAFSADASLLANVG